MGPIGGVPPMDPERVQPVLPGAGPGDPMAPEPPDYGASTPDIDSNIAPAPPGLPQPHGMDEYSLATGQGPSGLMAGEMAASYEMEKPIDKDSIKGLTDEVLDQLSKDIRHMVTKAMDAREEGGRDDNIALARSAFECEPPAKSGPWEGSSRLVPPDARVQVETITSREVEALTASGEWLKVISDNPDDSEACRKCVEFAMSEFKHTLRHQGRMVGSTKTMNVDGTIILRTFWNKRIKSKNKRVVVDNNLLQMLGMPPVTDPKVFPVVRINGRNYLYGQRIKMAFDEVETNHFDYDFINVKDFMMWPPTATEIENAVMVGHFFEQTPDQMKDMVTAGYYDKEKVKKALETVSMYPQESDVPRSSLDDDDEERLDGVARGKEADFRKYTRRRLLHCYARIHDADIKDQLDPSDPVEDQPWSINDDLCFVVDWSSGVIVKCGLNPYDNGKRPYCRFHSDPRVGGGFYSYSLMEKLQDLGLELAAVTRQGIDMATLAGTVIIEQEPGRRRLEDIRLHPGINIWQTTTDGEIKKVHQMPDVPASNLVNRGDIRSSMEKASGAVDVFQGSSGGSETLGQTELQVSGGNIRLKMHVIPMMDGMTWLFKQFFDYNLQYMEDSRRYGIIVNGRPINDSISIADIAVTQYATVEAYSKIIDPDAALEAQTAEKAFTVLMQSPFVQGNLPRMYQVTEDYLLAIGYQEELSARIGTKQEWAQMQAAQDQMQRQQMALQSQMAQSGMAMDQEVSDAYAGGGQPPQGPIGPDQLGGAAI